MDKKIKASLELTPMEWKLLIMGLECSAQESTTDYEERINMDLAHEVERQLSKQEYEGCR